MPKKAEEKATETKPVEKKPAAPKAEPVKVAVVQVGGREFDIAEITERAYAAYKADHKRKAVKEFKVYVKPEDNAAYYTVNGEGSDDFKIEL